MPQILGTDTTTHKAKTQSVYKKALNGMARSQRQEAQFERTYSKAPWETEVGYCRAIRAGSHIYVTGTAPVAEGGGVFAPGDGYAQAKRCLEIIEKALTDLGCDRTRVVRTRMFVTDISRWAEFGKAHRKFFGENRPATTMLEVRRLIHPDMLIEIEADAITL